MRIITRQEIINGVADSYHDIYHHRFNHSTHVYRMDYRGRKFKDTWKLLQGAGSRAEINKIIGNGSWTENNCMQCGEDCDKLFFFDLGDWESEASICKQCLTNGLELLEGD